MTCRPHLSFIQSLSSDLSFGRQAAHSFVHPAGKIFLSIASGARYEVQQRLEQSNPLDQCGVPTAKGAVELLRLSRAARSAAALVTMPTLLIHSGKDRVVSNCAEDRAASRMIPLALDRKEAGHSARLLLAP